VDTQVLRSFTSAAELGSLSRAAVALGVAQSALSRHLAVLEAQVGGRLFHRTGRGVTLTDLGATLLPQAQAILADLQAMLDDAHQVLRMPRGSVTVGMVPAWSHLLVGRLIAWQGAHFPGIRLRVMEGYSGDVQEWLSSGQVDVGVFNLYRPMRSAQALVTSTMQLILRADDPRAAHAQTFKTLGEIPLALPTRPNSLRGILDELCHRAGIVLDVRLEANSAVAIQDAVLRGGLYSVMPRHAIAQSCHVAGMLKGVPIVQPWIRQRTFLETTRYRPMSAATREVWRALAPLLQAVAHPRDTGYTA